MRAIHKIYNKHHKVGCLGKKWLFCYGLKSLMLSLKRYDENNMNWLSCEVAKLVQVLIFNFLLYKSEKITMILISISSFFVSGHTNSAFFSQSQFVSNTSHPRTFRYMSQSRPWASEGFFPRGRAIVDFSRGYQKDFSAGGKNGEISFFLSKLKQPFFLKI